MKKIVMAGLLCCVMLTGCGMPDKVSDMLQDIDVEMLNTEEEIDAAIEQVSDGEEAWVLSQRRQQQILELKEFLVEQKKKGVLKIEYDDESDKSLLEKWAVAKQPDDESFFRYDSDSNSYWNLSFRDEESLMQFFRDLEKLGYTGMTEPVKKGMVKISDEDGDFIPGASLKRKGITFRVDRLEGDSYALVMIQVSRSSIRYPASLQELLENVLTDTFSVEYIKSGGYLQAVKIYRESSLTDSPYDENILLYLKDGKLLQMEMTICESSWVIDMQEQGKLKMPDTFFTQEECETLKKMLLMLGADESSAQDFLTKLSPKSDRSGSIGSAKWYLKETTEMYASGSEDRHWFIRIQ